MDQGTRVPMASVKKIVLIAHDSRKQDLLEWVKFNRAVLREHELFATGPPARSSGRDRSSGGPLQERPAGRGPAGGREDRRGRPRRAHLLLGPAGAAAHDPDVKALLRIAVLYNIPTACNRATADFIVASSLFHGSYDRLVDDHAAAREAWLRSLAKG